LRPGGWEWPAALLWSLALLLGVEMLLRWGGFRYAHIPVSMRYVSTLARIGTEQTLHKRRFHIDYALDRTLLWKPVPNLGITNSEGFLGPEWRGGKGPLRRLIALGDSCTVAGEDPYPALLGRSLSGWEVWNAGVGSWSSFQGLQLLRTRLSSYRPDAVTVYFGWNDHWLAWAAPDKELSSLLDRQWRLLKLVERSRLLQALLKAANVLRAGGKPGPPDFAPYRVSEEDYEANLRGIVGAVRAAGGRPLLLTAPSALTPGHPTTISLCRTTRNFDDPARIAAVHAAYNERVRRASLQTGAVLVDLERHFAARPASEGFFTDGIHLTAKGHAAAAELIKRALLSQPDPSAPFGSTARGLQGGKY
ncbi:MAG: SGNH/GDSL hydrolase family protein, partial [Elusimicrobiota bacterium]